METKAFYKSKTFWGVIISILGSFSFGQNIIETLGLTPDTAVGYVDQVLQVGGAALALFGRVKADTKLGLKTSK